LTYIAPLCAFFMKCLPALHKLYRRKYVISIVFTGMQAC